MLATETCTETYTVKSLAEAVNRTPEEMAGRIKTLERRRKNPDVSEQVSDETARKILGLFQAVSAKQLSAASAPPVSTEETTQEPQYEEPGRLSIKEIGTIAKQYGVSRSLAIELEQAAYERHLYLVFAQEQLRIDAEQKVREAARTARLLQEIEQKEAESDDLERSLLHQQQQQRLESVDEKFGLGLQDAVARLQQQTEDRAKRELRRRQWLQDIENGKPLPDEAMQDFFVLSALQKRAG